MTSTIKVNNIQNQCGANIINENSNTITIGASGDTIALASGASQTGFGRTGTVDWETTIKTGDFTASSGDGYFVNTTSGAITMTLPASPSAGDIVSVKDYAYKFGTNALTVNRNGSPIGGGTSFNPEFISDGAFITFIYADATKGWLLTDEANNTTSATNTFVAATGGTITTSGDFKIHTFTGPGTFEVTSCAQGPVAKVSYLVLAGAGGGGSRQHGAGGGAGGYRESKSANCSYTASPTASTTGLLVSKGSFPITVGAGGAGGPTGGSPNNNPGTPGSDSIFSSIVSAGGGRGLSFTSASNFPTRASSAGGSGGGGGGSPTCVAGGGVPGGSGNTPPVSPAQGTDGGKGDQKSNNGGGGGGGGATDPGTNATCGGFGTGGDGATTNITASPVAYAGGGGGANYCSPSCYPGGGAGGTGGGGAGTGVAGTTNRGAGGGAGGGCTTGGAGGSGIVVIRYKFQ
jgi:hypothetical protein